MFRIERSGDYVKVNGMAHELEEFTRILRGCVLRGNPYDKLICRLAGRLDKMVKDNVEVASFRLDNIDKYLNQLMKDVIPGNFIDMKYKQVKDLESVKLTSNNIFGSILNSNMDVYVIEFDIFKNLKPKFVPKDIELKPTSIDEL